MKPPKTEKERQREEAIQNGGFYNVSKDGVAVWNSIKKFPGDDRLYRERVETLIVKDNKEVFVKKKPNGEYYLPGGSTEKDCTHIQQAINECREEARINIRNIESTGITYKKKHEVPDWAKKTCAVEWKGTVTEVYVAEYDSSYKGRIEKVDQDPFILSGRFYSTKECFKFFSSEHREALLWYLKNHLNNDDEEEMISESYISNYFKNKKLLKNISTSQDIERSAVEQMISVLKKTYSELSGKSKIKRERQREDVSSFFHPVLTFDFSDKSTIIVAICFDDKEITDGVAFHTDEYGDIVVVYPCFFKSTKENQVFTLLHEIGHVRLNHLSIMNSHHKPLSFKDNTNEYREKIVKKGKAMYPEINADLYAMLNGAKLYTILNSSFNKDTDEEYDYRFTNAELADRYSKVFKKYNQLNQYEEGESKMNISEYDIACLAIHEMVYENASNYYLTEGEKDALYQLVYEFGINKVVKDDPEVKKAEERLKTAKERLKKAKLGVKEAYHLNAANPAFMTDEQKKTKQEIVQSMRGNGIENSRDRELYAARAELAAADNQLTTIKSKVFKTVKSNAKLDKNANKKTQNGKIAGLVAEKAMFYDDIYESMNVVLEKLKSQRPTTESANDKRSKYIYLLESTFSESVKYKDVKESDFGIPETRSFPLDTKDHVISAYKLFGKADPKYQEDLAKKIFNRMKKYGISKDVIGEKSKIYEYIGLW